MKRRYSFVFLLAIVAAVSSCASSHKGLSDAFGPIPQFCTYYYQHKQPDRISWLITEIDNSPLRERLIGSMSGFLSGVFRENPDKIDAWIKDKNYRYHTKAIFVDALCSLDQCDRALKYVRPEISEKIPSSKSGGYNLRTATPEAPRSLDRNWGAFLATGDVTYVKNILRALERISENPNFTVQDMAEVARSMEKAKDNVSPAVKDKIKALEKGGKNKDLGEFLVGTTALWSLSSNAKQHPLVKKAIFDSIPLVKNQDLKLYLSLAIADKVQVYEENSSVGSHVSKNL